MSRGAGEGTRCRVPSPDLIFPLDRGSSVARSAGIGISLFYWGRNPLNGFANRWDSGPCCDGRGAGFFFRKAARRRGGGNSFSQAAPDRPLKGNLRGIKRPKSDEGGVFHRGGFSPGRPQRRRMRSTAYPQPSHRVCTAPARASKNRNRFV